MLYAYFRRFDWVLIGALIPLFIWSLLTLKAVGTADDYFFTRQIVWIGVGFFVMFFMASINWRILANSGIILFLYAIILAFLGVLFLSGTQVKGAVSWFDFYIASFQPAEIVKLILILIIAKYFSRRHIDMARFRHVVVSGLYAALPITLILLQPDLGTAAIIFSIWLGVTLVAGIRMRHIIVLAVAGIVLAVAGWTFFLEPYQQVRVTSFLNPAADPRGAGYNAIQSMIAVGSGQLLGKGVGYGSQSRLQFLPESHTDFIFAAFAEEWGFVGVLLLFIFLGIVIWRILVIGMSSGGNFTKLFAVGVSIMIVVQVVIHAGMNMGLLPVTGITFPFMSYGGSSLITFFAALGILQNIYAERRTYTTHEIENT
jgi:rod shape determining protein RodA